MDIDWVPKSAKTHKDISLLGKNMTAHLVKTT